MWNASALLHDEPLADGGNAVGRANVDIPLLNEETTEHLEKYKVIVSGLSAVVSVEEDIVEEINAETLIVLVSVIYRLYACGILPEHVDVRLVAGIGLFTEIPAVEHSLHEILVSTERIAELGKF